MWTLGIISREPSSFTRRNLSEFELVTRNEAREAKSKQEAPLDRSKYGSIIHLLFIASAITNLSLNVDVNSHKRKRYDNNQKEGETYQSKRRVPCHKRVSLLTAALEIVRKNQIGDLYEPRTAHRRTFKKMLSKISGEGHIDESEAFITLVNNIEEYDDESLEILDVK